MASLSCETPHLKFYKTEEIHEGVAATSRHTGPVPERPLTFRCFASMTIHQPYWESDTKFERSFRNVANSKSVQSELLLSVSVGSSLLKERKIDGNFSC